MRISSLAIIPDGNRRYGRKTGFSTQNAYLAGFEKAEEVIKWAGEAGIKSLTFWALSLENFSERSKPELSVLFTLMRKHCEKAFSSKTFDEEGVRVKFFGRLDLLPEDLVALMRQVEEKTSNNSRVRLNVAIAYSGRDELLQAAKKLVELAKNNPSAEVGEKQFEQLLYLHEAPDLIIRTGNVQRLSGFLPWQAGYSELFFSPKLWPEFSRADFKAALAFYENAERRFGK